MNNVVLSVKKLNLKIKNKPLLENVSFSVEKGDFLAISGIKGSGKTALIKSLLGIIADGLTGEILYHGIGKSDVTYIPQNVLDLKEDFLGTSREVIALGLISKKAGRCIDADDWKKVDQILDAFGMGEVKDKKINKLTQWQQFKVKLARALITDPKIIFIDDPAPASNAKAKAELYKIIKYSSSELDIASVLILPDIKGVLSIADNVLFLDKKENSYYFGKAKDFVLPVKSTTKTSVSKKPLKVTSTKGKVKKDKK